MENNNMPPQQNTPIPPAPPFNTPPVPPFVTPPPRRKKWPFIVGGVLILLAVVVLVLTRSGGSDNGPSKPAAPTDETQYLIFNVGTYGDPTVPKSGSETYGEAVSKDIDKKLQDVIDRLGTTGDANHKLGFMVILHPWMWNSGFGTDHSQFDVLVEKAFDLAAKRGMAVYFTIDSNYGETANIYNWWDPSLSGYNPENKKNVEWTDWEGTATKARYSLQGSGAKLPPVMCYNSPTVLKESSYLAESVIAPAMLKGIESLKKAGKENLFAGITVGLEPSIDDYTEIDKMDPAVGKHMDEDGALKTRLGYCALTNAGYSKSNPPASYADALAKINQEYTSYWARLLVDAGLSKDRLYTHVAAGAEGLSLQYTNAPIWTAFNDYSRPGWTTYAAGPISDNFNVLYEALAEHGNPHWGATETSPTSLTGRPLKPETFLAWHYNHGATVMMMNTADASAGGQVIGKDIWSKASLAAYKKFLSGEALQE